jgi:outer membrane protein X
MIKEIALLSMLFTVMSLSSSQAQEKGDWALGANYSYGAGHRYENMGIGIKYQYHVSNSIRIEPSATYYWPKDHLSLLDVGLNGHYVFPLSEEFNLYPLVGVGLFNYRFSYEGTSDGDSQVTVNLGAGAEYLIDNSYKFTLEYKYVIVNEWNRSIISLGFAVLF